MTPRCRRCSGSLRVSIDPEDGSRVGECVSCGQLAAWEQLNEVEREGVDWRRRESQEDAMTTTPDGRSVLRAELDAILARIRSVEDDKAQAEKIVAALTVLDVPDLPELPWKAKAAKSGGPRAWTTDEDATLLRLRAEGVSGPEIARTLGRAVSAVYTRVGVLLNREAVPA